MARVKDLSHIDGTYTKVLNDNIQTIYSNYATMSFYDFKNYIIELVKQANDTNARRNFLFNIERKRNKTELMFYVNDAFMRGQGLGVDIYDKFAK